MDNVQNYNSYINIPVITSVTPNYLRNVLLSLWRQYSTAHCLLAQ
jgi:hypothetical protein